MTPEDLKTRSIELVLYVTNAEYRRIEVAMLKHSQFAAVGEGFQANGADFALLDRAMLEVLGDTWRRCDNHLVAVVAVNQLPDERLQRVK